MLCSRNYLPSKAPIEHIHPQKNKPRTTYFCIVLGFIDCGKSIRLIHNRDLKRITEDSELLENAEKIFKKFNTEEAEDAENAEGLIPKL